MINILLFGPPGAGKGTQADFIVKRFGLKQVSTGDIIRAEVSKGSELGKAVVAQMEAGKLASDEIVISIIENYIRNTEDLGNGIIFDGFPRTINQAKELDNLLNKIGSSVTALISLEVPREEVIKRMLERGKVSGRVDDLNEDVIRNRIAIYDETTHLVKEHYRQQGKCFEVDGAQSISSVTESIVSVISDLK